MDEYNKMRGGFLGTLFKGDRISHLSNKVASVVGIKKTVNLKKDDENIQKAQNEYSILTDLCKKNNFDILCKIINNIDNTAKINY